MENIELSDPLKSFFKDFYAASDDPTALERYADDFFEPTARMTLASRVVNGRDEIIALRRSMVSSVRSRRHTVYGVFPHLAVKNECMLRGLVEYVQHDDTETTAEWAAWAKFANHGGTLRFAEYHVYIDTGKK